MAKKHTLFRSEEWKARRSAAAFLRELADKLEEGEITLRRGGDEVSLVLPETVELEIEIEWTQEQTEGSVTLG